MNFLCLPLITIIHTTYLLHEDTNKSKGIKRQVEVALGVPGGLRPRIFLTFGTTRVIGHQQNALAAFTPGEIPGTHFQRLSRPQGTWFCRKEPRNKPQVTPPGIDPRTIQPVAQCLNHYATPGPKDTNMSAYNEDKHGLSSSLTPCDV
jgi:hypothetical protein